jgi:GTP cyclohydrolase I
MTALCRGILEELPGEVTASVHPEHWRDTPERMAKHFSSIFWGCHHDPAKDLKVFTDGVSVDQIVLVQDIEFVSWCSHHVLPFFGHVDFAYIPSNGVVGLSKIPRMISVLAARPQIQEHFTQQIADVFADAVKPLGIAVRVRASHTCVMARGVALRDAVMQTAVMQGVFRDKPEARAEFLAMVK